MHTLRLAIKRARLSKQEARDIEDVTADISENELFEFLQEGLIVEHWKAIHVVDVRSMNRANGP